ncbi:MAG: DUF1223 domain-containing protein [Rhodanobacteraceae bacterium]
MRVSGLFALLAAVSPAVHAACTATSTNERPHVVELYTAEGCSSCPPAEKWLSTLRDSSNYIGLEFHVDYWDELGWHDPYGDARYSERQREFARREANNQVYTPQIAVDGRAWRTWPKAPPPEAGEESGPALNLEVVRGDTLDVKVGGDSAAPAGGSYRIFVALSENGLSTAVKAGENKGKQLDHDQVVRDFAGPIAWPGAKATLKVPAGLDPAKSSVVAFVEDTRSGDIVQAVRLPLAQCAL